MHRGPLAAVQHRKFRLLVRWKTALKAAASFRVLPPKRFPHSLAFRVFEEIVRLTKRAATGSPLDAGRSSLTVSRGDVELSPDQFMDVILVGREVVADYLASDTKLVATYTADARNCVRHALDEAVRNLVDREMQAYFLRRGRAEKARAETDGAPGRDRAWDPVEREA